MLDSEHDAGQEPAVANRTTDDGPAQKQSTTTAQQAATPDTADTGDEARPRRRAASRPAGPPASQTAKKSSATKTAAKKSSATKTAAKKTSAKTAAPDPRTGSDGAETPTDDTAGQSVDNAVAEPSAAKQGSAKRATTKRSTGAKSAAAAKSSTSASASASETEADQTSASTSSAKKSATKKSAAKKSAATKTSAQQTATQQTGAVDGGESAQGTVDAPASPSDAGSPAAEQAETGETTRAGGDTKHTSHTRGQRRGNRSQPQEEPAQTDPAIEAALESAWRQKKAGHTQPDPDQQAAGDTSGPKQPVDSPEGPSSADGPDEATAKTGEQDESGDQQGGGNARRRRRRGGRRRRREPGDHDADGEPETATSHNRTATPASGEDGTGDRTSNKGRDQAGSSSERTEEAPAQADQNADDKSDDKSEDNSGDNGGRRRRRRRRRRGESSQGSSDDPNDVVTKVRDRRQGEQSDEVSGVDGSTRVEAKRIRRREGRDSGRRRAPILSEQEFLARRESVDRKMVIRQLEEYAQIAVLEDGILVEHYVDRADSSSLIGNVYLGRVQNVLPSMEAAFVDIGRGRNAVLYAGDLDWDGLGAQGEDRKVENVLKSGQSVLVQVTKDPIGAKGARLTHHISMPGRYVVYAPAGHVSGISRKLPEEERQRLKNILAGPVGDEASVIIRTAAEGASEDELTRDVDRLKAQWESIEKKVKTGQAPQVLYAEPDLTLRIVRDLFTEDFSELVIQGNGSMTDAHDSVDAYLNHVAPHLADRVRRWDTEASGDLFGSYRLDEQIAKALERKVFLPSGGSLIVDRTEAMTVIDVNTGKFTGNGGNLEATVASNNLEAAEEIARQLRLRDIGGIIVIDFIDMVLPNNRELLLRRLVESLGRDRTRHQVTEVTSLGLVQMTRKRIGSGLLEAFSSQCPHCHGRGVELHDMPVADKQLADGGARNDQNRGRGSNKRRSRSRSGQKKNADGQDDGANDRSDQKNESDTGTQQDAGDDATSQETQPA